MYQKKIPPQLNCGLHFFKELLNGKWKLMLLYYISEGNKRPSELQKKIPNADRRVMDIQLKELTQHGFIRKQSFQSKIPKVEYELLPLGQSLLPLIIEIEKWGEDHRGELENALVNDRKFEDVISSCASEA
ncbi:MAG: helix-turn-helix domain-containing protein [Flavobacterium sp.]